MGKYNEWILIVEDDSQIRNFIAYALKNEGFSYVTANNAQNALNILISEQIDIMLLDLGLPDLDGMEVIKKVREWSEMPIIVVSARDQDKEKALALDRVLSEFWVYVEKAGIKYLLFLRINASQKGVFVI